jgi:putative ABC transport system permease protein
MSLFETSWRNITFRKTLSWLTILSVALATALVVFITLAQEGLQRGAAKGYGPYEVVVGAEGSGSQLVLNTFYYLGAPTGNIKYSVYEKLTESGLADKAYPITKGDNYQGFQIVGTPAQYLSTRYPEAVLADGKLYNKAGETVIGAHVAKDLGLKVGSEFISGHGVIDTGLDTHQELSYKVVGILPPLHTPDDKAIFTTLDAAWIVHGQGEHEAEAHEKAETHDSGQEEEESHTEHEAEGDITAIVIKPKGLIELQTIKNKFNDLEGVQAVYSSKEIADILNIMDVGAQIVKVIAGAGILIAAISILLSLTASAAERKKDIGLLRLLGKSKVFIMSGMMIEGGLLTFVGVCLGMVLGHVGSAVLSPSIFQYTGIQINPWGFVSSEIIIIAGAMVIGIVSSVWPALRAYKVQPLEFLR